MIFNQAVKSFKNESYMTLQSTDGWGFTPGQTVSQTTAMKVSAVNACVEVISNSVSKLPFFVIDSPTKERVRHPVNQLLATRPNEAMTPSVFKKLIEVYRLLWGNAYILPVRSSKNARVTELLPVPPDYMYPYIHEDGQLWYVLTVPLTGEQRKFRAWDVIHLKAYSVDGINGISVLSRAAEVVGTSKSAQTYESKLYSQNARPSGVLSVASKLDKTSKDKIRNEWASIHSGVDNAFKVAVLDLGLDYKQTGMTQRDAQFVESKNVTVEDIARFFGVPLYKINAGKQSYSSNEQNAIEYVVNTLHPIIEQYEEELGYKLLFDSELKRGLEIKANMNAELRGDFSARGNWYKNMRETGAFSVNDILALENMPPVDGGDTRLASLNYVPLEDFRDLSTNRNQPKGGDN